MDYPELDILDDADEKMLRRLVEADKSKAGRMDVALYRAEQNSHEGAIIRRLDQAHMINVDYRGSNPIVLEVYAAGYSYVTEKNREAEAEKKRVRERKEDMRHDWRITAFSAVAGILGVVVGFFLGRL